MRTGETTSYNMALREMRKKRPNIALVLRLLERARGRHDSRAAYALGTWYLHGKNVKKSLSKAVALLREGASGGVPAALFDLGVCFESGVGVSKNLKRAYRCYVEAALRGDRNACYEVGRCLYYGIGVARDRRVAWVWLDHAGQIIAATSTEGGRKASALSRQ